MTDDNLKVLKPLPGAETDRGFSSPRDGGIGGSSVCLRSHSGADAGDI